MSESDSRPEALESFSMIVSQESGPNRATHTSQIEFGCEELENFVVTDSPPPSGASTTGSSGDSGGEDKRESAGGLDKALIRSNSEKAADSIDSLEVVESCATSILGESSSSSETTAYRMKKPSGESVAERARIRASCFADTLAKLEGHAPRRPLSPIQRYVYPERLYSDSVELEDFGPILQCPRPMSWAKSHRISKLLQAEVFDRSCEVRFHEFASHDEPIHRPMKPIPNRAFFS